MKKLFLLIVVLTTLAFKPSDSLAQQTYEMGYVDGFQFAIERCLVAAAAHPEWSYSVVMKTYYVQYGVGVYSSYTIVDDSGQAAQLAVNYVHASYYSGITANRTINSFYQGYYDGYLQGTSEFVIGPF